MGDSNNNTQNKNNSTNQTIANNSAYDSLMKSVGTENAAKMRPISEGFSLRKDVGN